jgi:hypothetical protein
MQNFVHEVATVDLSLAQHNYYLLLKKETGDNSRARKGRF